jgi:hypothetical protein
MNVLLSLNNIFKWGGLMNIKWDSLFGYSNHALTLLLDQNEVNYYKLIKILKN